MNLYINKKKEGKWCKKLPLPNDRFFFSPIPWIHKKFTKLIHSVFSSFKVKSFWYIPMLYLFFEIKTKKHVIFCEKILTFMNFHCNEACILCCMYVWKLFWGNPFHFCLSILLADVYSYLICLLHSNVNSSQYMSKWMTCIILIIMYYFIICFDRSCKDYFIRWNYWSFI